MKSLFVSLVMCRLLSPTPTFAQRLAIEYQRAQLDLICLPPFNLLPVARVLSLWLSCSKDKSLRSSSQTMRRKCDIIMKSIIICNNHNRRSQLIYRNKSCTVLHSRIIKQKKHIWSTTKAVSFGELRYFTCRVRNHYSPIGRRHASYASCLRSRPWNVLRSFKSSKGSLTCQRHAFCA